MFRAGCGEASEELRMAAAALTGEFEGAAAAC